MPGQIGCFVGGALVGTLVGTQVGTQVGTLFGALFGILIFYVRLCLVKPRDESASRLAS
jgi:tetrahydromethanopterin S-methyltransferase subunit G